MKKWEYKIAQYTKNELFDIRFSKVNPENALNNLGNQGWELVSTSPLDEDCDRFLFIFKREI